MPDNIIYKSIYLLTRNKLLPSALLAMLLISVLFLFSLTEYRSLSFESRNRLTVFLEFSAGSRFQYVKKTADSVEKELLDYISGIQPDNVNSGSLLSGDHQEKISLVIKAEKREDPPGY